MKKAVLFFLLFAVVGSISQTQPSQSEPILSSYLVPWADKAALGAIADLFEIHEKREKGFEVIVPERAIGELKRLSPHAVLIEQDIDAKTRDINRQALRGYHDFSTVESHLRKIEAENFDLAQVETYGKSKEGRPLFALRLEGRALAVKKEVMLTASTHGNELITVEVLFGLLDRLVKGYGNDARLTQILDSHIIYFIPVVNPDGYTRRSRYANGIDPNRDYPWPEQPNRDPNPAIKSIMDLFDQHEFAGSLDYHSAIGTVMYPWSYTESPVTQNDQRRFADVARRMAATNGYQHGQIPHLLYIAKGASADYYYWKKKTLAMAVEISDSNTPPESKIPHYVDENAEALWIFLEAV